MPIYGYARVSTYGQSLDVQLARLGTERCATVFREKASGARFDRPELQRLLHKLRAGDVVIVTRLDRLARSTRDLLNIITAITQAGAAFRSLADAWADSKTAHGRLMLTILGGLAEFEREMIRARTMEGRARARLRGVKFGRHPKLSVLQREEALARRAAGETPEAIARSYNVSRWTILRL